MRWRSCSSNRHRRHMKSSSASGTYLGSSHLSAASINRRLATLRSVSKLGRMLGMMTWYLEVPGVKAEKRRQTAGPTVDDVRRLLAATSGNTEAETRNAAIVTVFYCLGL